MQIYIRTNNFSFSFHDFRRQKLIFIYLFTKFSINIYAKFFLSFIFFVTFFNLEEINSKNFNIYQEIKRKYRTKTKQNKTMSAETLMKNDMLMRQSGDVGVDETSESAGILNENFKALNNNKNGTASALPIDGSYLFIVSFIFVCLLTLVLLFRFKNPLQFYVKYTVYVCLTMTYSLFCIPFTLLKPNNARNIE